MRMNDRLLRRIRPGRRAGFTLIEVMLAVAILATIVVLTWGTVSSSFRLGARRSTSSTATATCNRRSIA